MTPQQVAAIYAELERMVVLVQQQPQLGFTFYAEQIADGRVKQDRLGDLIIAVNKETARVRVALRTLKEVARLGGSVQEERTQEMLNQLANEADELKFLQDSLGIKAALVRQAIFDIRLLVQIMETQVRLGEVQPVSKPVPVVSAPPTLESAMMVERFLDSAGRGTPNTSAH